MKITSNSSASPSLLSGLFSSSRKPKMLKAKVREDFYRQMVSFTNNGVGLSKALQQLSEIYQRYGDKRAGLMYALSQRLRAGATIGGTFRGYLPESELAMIEASEESDVTLGFNNALYQISETSKLKNSMGKLISPMIQLTMLIAILLSFSIGLFPQFAELVGPDKWPKHTKLLYDFGQFVINNGPFILLVITLLGIYIYWSLPRQKGPFREKYLTYIPPWTFYRQYVASNFLIGLAAMNGSGIAFNDALGKIAANANPYLRFHIMTMRAELRKGKKEGMALSTNVFDKETKILINIYGEGADFDQALERVGKDTVELTARQIEKFANSAGLILKAAIAGGVVWIIMAMLGMFGSIEG